MYKSVPLYLRLADLGGDWAAHTYITEIRGVPPVYNIASGNKEKLSPCKRTLPLGYNRFTNISGAPNENILAKYLK